MAGIDDENDGKAEEGCEIGSRTLGPLRSVEEAHDPLDDNQVRILCEVSEKCADNFGPHGPGIEIETRPTARRLVEAGVDIVGAYLGGGNPEPPVTECPDQAKGYQRLAAAGMGCGDHQGLSQ